MVTVFGCLSTVCGRGKNTATEAHIGLFSLTHTHTHTHMHTHAHMHTHTYTHMHTHAHMHSHAHTCTHTHTKTKKKKRWDDKGLASMYCLLQMAKTYLLIRFWCTLHMTNSDMKLCHIIIIFFVYISHLGYSKKILEQKKNMFAKAYLKYQKISTLCMKFANQSKQISRRIAFNAAP